MRNFDDVWKVANTIRGWFDEREARFLFNLISFDKPKRMVELGSYVGRSSIIFSVLALDLNLEFITVDDLSSKNTRDELLTNMEKAAGRFIFLQMTSDKAFKLFDTDLGAYVGKPIDLLFIDTVHTYSHVKKDCDLWLPKVRKGGFVLFHDYCDKYHGVVKAVDERKELKKINLSYTLMTTVKL